MPDRPAGKSAAPSTGSTLKDPVIEAYRQWAAVTGRAGGGSRGRELRADHGAPPPADFPAVGGTASHPCIGHPVHILLVFLTSVGGTPPNMQMQGPSSLSTRCNPLGVWPRPRPMSRQRL